MRRFIRTAFIAVDLLIVILFLAGYLAYFVHPAVVWWFDLVAVVLPYLGIAVVAATVGLVLLRQWHLVLLHGVLLVLLLLRVDAVNSSTDGSRAASDTLSVLTFNVPRWWGYEMPAKTNEMGALIQAVEPDVIGLQEAPIAYFKKEGEPPLRAAPYVSILYDSLGFSTIGRSSPRPTSTPQPVLSRHELIRQDEFELRRSPRDTLFTHVTRTRIRWNGREFMLYNVHLRTFGMKKPWHEDRGPLLDPANVIPYLRQYRDVYRARAWEIEEIVKMVEEEDLPVILCGDLNSTPNNWVHGRLTDVLQDAFAEAGRGWGMTYHTRLPLVRIDYVFVSEEWDVVSARVLDAYLSDHLPLVVKLRWKG